MLLLIAAIGIVLGGLTAIALAHPSSVEFVVWNDDAERRMLRDARTRVGWW